MRFTETPVTGAFLIEPDSRRDDRGWFSRVWCQREFAEHGLNGTFVQCNASFSRHSGTLRGLHYQTAPYAEAKLIRCLRGAIFDVIVDVRPESSTYLRWYGTQLTPDGYTMLYVPEGCAHGYLTLEDHSEVEYPVSQFYRPDAERGIRWNDPSFAIAWPQTTTRTISVKDQSWPDFVR